MLHNRRFTLLLVISLVFPACIQQLIAAEVTQKTYVYKTVDEHAIKADVYRPADDTVRPVVVWIHGGALINGNREGVSQRVKQWAASSGYALVSIDYRLAPETKLPEIISDVEDAFTWIRRQGPEKFQIDPERLVVCGGSAGGYLTLTTGFRVKPQPRALLAFWGYGDLVGPWYSKPSPHPRHRRTQLSKEDAWKQVSGHVVSDSRQRDGNGGAFYQYCRQMGSWPQAVTGWDPHDEEDKFFPYMALKNVTATYPPTILIHGTADTDVPHEQSLLMAAEMKKHGVSHQLISIEGAEHGLAGGDARAINEAYRKGFAFLDRYLAK